MRQSDRDTAQHYKDLADVNPEMACESLTDIRKLLHSQDEQTRHLGMQAVVKLSGETPFLLKPAFNDIRMCLSDAESAIRANAAIAIWNLATWLPQYFDPAVPPLLDVAESENDTEHISATAALAEIARQRPDLITDRARVLAAIDRLEDSPPADASIPQPDGTLLHEARTALAGGDMASRSVERDLAPVGEGTPLSYPARLGLMAVLWPLFAFWLLSSIAIWISLLLVNNKQIPTASVPTRHVFTHQKRFTLYLRRSMAPAPSKIIPWMPGTVVQPVDMYAEDVLPDNWEAISQTVWERDGGRCRNCHTDTGQSSEFQAYIDLRESPTDRSDGFAPPNLRTLCRPCFEIRHGRGVE